LQFVLVRSVHQCSLINGMQRRAGEVNGQRFSVRGEGVKARRPFGLTLDSVYGFRGSCCTLPHLGMVARV
jgi:hypothetical protein